MHVVLPFLLPKTKIALLRGFSKSCLWLRAAIFIKIEGEGLFCWSAGLAAEDRAIDGCRSPVQTLLATNL